MFTSYSKTRIAQLIQNNTSIRLYSFELRTNKNFQKNGKLKFLQDIADDFSQFFWKTWLACLTLIKTGITSVSLDIIHT